MRPKQDISELINQLKRFFRQSDCLWPGSPLGCSGNAIAAHSLQRSTALSSIAEHGHVLTFHPDIVAMVKYTQNEERTIPVVDGVDSEALDFLAGFAAGFAEGPHCVGLREASTFLGFCNAHDTSIFAPVETKPLAFNPEQCFLLAYRAVCFEVMRKRGAVKHAEWLAEKYPGENSAESLKASQLGFREISEEKSEYDKILIASDYSSISFCVWELDGNPGFAASGFINPEMDFCDNCIQNVMDLRTPLQHLAFTVLPALAGGYAVLTWIGCKPACRQFAESWIALGNTEWPDALLRVAAESVENFYLSPSWHGSLDEIKTAWIKLRVGTGGVGLRPISYKPDGVGFTHFRAILSQTQFD